MGSSSRWLRNGHLGTRTRVSLQLQWGLAIGGCRCKPRLTSGGGRAADGPDLLNQWLLQKRRAWRQRPAEPPSFSGSQVFSKGIRHVYAQILTAWGVPISLPHITEHTGLICKLADPHFEPWQQKTCTTQRFTLNSLYLDYGCLFVYIEIHHDPLSRPKGGRTNGWDAQRHAPVRAEGQQSWSSWR